MAMRAAEKMWGGLFKAEEFTSLSWISPARIPNGQYGALETDPGPW